MPIGFLALLVIDAILFVASALLMPRPKLKGVSPTFPDRPTSKEGGPVPVIWGTILIPANVTHFSDVAAVEQTEKVATGLFSSHRVTVGYSYSAIMQCILCHGPINEIQDIIWQDILGLNDTNIVTVQEDDGSGHFHLREVTEDYTNPSLPQVALPADGGTEFVIFAKELFGGYKHGGGVQGIMRMYWGLATQTADLTLKAITTPVVGSPEYPAYKGIAHVVFGRKVGSNPLEPFNFGEFGTIPPVAFLIRRNPSNLGLSGSVTNINGGANPAECIYEVLTNTIWGLGMPGSELESSTFIACANTLATEAFGLHLSINQQESADQVITEVLRHIDGQLQQNPVTGKLELSLNRADYDPATLVLLDDTNSEIEITRPAWTSMVNQVKVTYTAQRGPKFTTIPTQPVDDIAAQREFGVVHSATIPFPGVRDPVLANQLAVRELRKGSTPLQQARIKTNRVAAGLKVGTPFKVTNAASGVNAHVFRVVSINFGTRLEGTIQIEAIEDIFNLDSPFYNVPIDAPAAWIGVGPTGPVQVVATPSSDETTGSLTLAILGGNGLATAVQFREQSGTAAFTAWHDNITSGRFYTEVDLDEKHPSVIGWRVMGHLKDGTTGPLAEGEAIYPIATRPGRPGVTYAVDSLGNVDLIIDVDQDAVAYKYLVLYDHVPTVAEVHAQASHAIVGPDRRIVIPNVAVLDGFNASAYAGVLAIDTAGAESPIGTTSIGIKSAPGQLAMRLVRSSADDSTVDVDVYVADSSPNPDSAIIIKTLSQGVDAVAAEDGSRSAVMGSRGNMIVQWRDVTQAPWADSGVGVSRAYNGAGIAPDGTLGVSEITWAATGPFIQQNNLLQGDFNGVTLSAGIWMRSSAAMNIAFGSLNELGGAYVNAAFVVTPQWKYYEVSGAGPSTTASLGFFIEAIGGVVGVLQVWGIRQIRGTFSDVTDDLDTTDFVPFKITRPARQRTATNLLLQSDALATAPWTGGSTVADNSAMFGGVNYSLIQNAAATVWIQQVNVPRDGVYTVTCRLHKYPGFTGPMFLTVYDSVAPAVITTIAVVLNPDGTMSFGGLAGTGSVLAIEPIDEEGSYQIVFRTGVITAANLLYIYANNSSPVDKFYISRFTFVEGPEPFPVEIPTTTQQATQTIDNPSGLVTFTVSRNGVAQVSQALTIEPSQALGDPEAQFTVEGEGTSEDGAWQGQVRIIAQFDEKTNQIDLYTAESPTANVPVDIGDRLRLVASLTREEGSIASQSNFKMEFDAGTHEGYYRHFVALTYGGRSLKQFSRVPPRSDVEAQAVDVGTPPSGPPTGLSVVFTSVNGIPRATISFVITDAAAEHRIFRNGKFLIRLSPGNNAVVDDNLTPLKAYIYDVQAIRNGQTSAFSTAGTGGGGGGGSSGGSTLPTPSFAPDYPFGGSAFTGVEDPYVNIRAVNSDPLATTQIWMSPGATDSGTFTNVWNLGPGSTDVTLYASSFDGIATGDRRYFYLISVRDGYTPSTQSTHKFADFRPDA